MHNARNERYGAGADVMAAVVAMDEALEVDKYRRGPPMAQQHFDSLIQRFLGSCVERYEFHQKGAQYHSANHESRRD